MSNDLTQDVGLAQTPVLRYSVSALRQQATCSARRYFWRLAKEKLIEVDPSIALVTGSAAHKGIELALKEGADPFKVAADYVQENLFDKFPAEKIDMVKAQERIADMNVCIANYMKHFHESLLQQLDDPQSSLEVTLEMPWRKGVLKGVIDVIAADGIFADWKTGKVPKEEMLGTDPQAAVYYYIAKSIGMTPPKVFNYVYLKGKPMTKKPELDEHGGEVRYKTGPRKGQVKEVWDQENNLKFTFPVLQDDDKVKRMMNDYIVPVAVAYENDIMFKNRSDYNCASCEYRTVCPSMTLPERTDYDIISPTSIQEIIDETRAQEAAESQEESPADVPDEDSL